MQYKSVKWNHRRDHYKYLFIKGIKWTRAHLEINSSKRKKLIQSYKYMFVHEYPFREGNGINSNQYYIPEALIVKDIISKEKLRDVKRGIKRIYKNYYSHKFLCGYRSEEDIENMIDNLDLTITEGESWHKFSRFDMESKGGLKNRIEYFDIVIRNFSASFLEIEFYIYFTDKQKEEYNKFISNDYKSKTKKVVAGYGKNKRKSGAKINYGIQEYLDEQEKYEILYDLISKCKYDFLKLMQRYFPMTMFCNDYFPSGVVICKTNIHYSEKCVTFWESVGLRSYEGIFINESIKLFPRKMLQREYADRRTDLVLVYNDETLESKYLDVYNNNKQFYIMESLFENLGLLNKALVIDDVADYYNEKCAYYRNKINNSRVGKWQYAYLLKLRYNFNIDFALMELLNKEVDIDKIRNEVEQFFEQECLVSYDKYKYYKCISTYPIRRYHNYVENKKLLESRLENKIILSGELRQYKNEKSNWKISVLALLLSIGTFILLIFPEWAEKIANILEYVFIWFKNVIVYNVDLIEHITDMLVKFINIGEQII